MGWRKKLVAIRGAISVEENSRDAILANSRQLIEKILLANQIELSQVVSIFFTATPDLNAEFPALAVRQLTEHFVPVLCASELNVPDAPQKIIRVLIHCFSRKPSSGLKHLYLKEAERLRPDLKRGAGC